MHVDAEGFGLRLRRQGISPQVCTKAQGVVRDRPTDHAAAIRAFSIGCHLQAEGAGCGRSRLSNIGSWPKRLPPRGGHTSVFRLTRALLTSSRRPSRPGGRRSAAPRQRRARVPGAALPAQLLNARHGAAEAPLWARPNGPEYADAGLTCSGHRRPGFESFGERGKLCLLSASSRGLDARIGLRISRRVSFPARPAPVRLPTSRRCRVREQSRDFRELARVVGRRSRAGLRSGDGFIAFYQILIFVATASSFSADREEPRDALPGQRHQSARNSSCENGSARRFPAPSMIRTSPVITNLRRFLASCSLGIVEIQRHQECPRCRCRRRPQPRGRAVRPRP